MFYDYKNLFDKPIKNSLNKTFIVNLTKTQKNTINDQNNEKNILVRVD